jgi:ATP-binding protein involved in chromosome partitioning
MTIESILQTIPFVDATLAAANPKIGIKDNTINIELDLPVGLYQEQLQQEITHILQQQDVKRPFHVNIESRILRHKVGNRLKPYEPIKNVIAVASGKGGVGKSTVAANLATALAKGGATVGLLDADIYGPSIPTLFGVKEKPDSPDGKHLLPIQRHGVFLMSIGFLMDDDTPAIWRGPMVTQALLQLIGDTSWPKLDYLIVDLPPGTGDVQLTLAQKIPVTGAVVVTTPQELALVDARKAIRMFEKVSVPVLGVVENMSLFICPKCMEPSRIFGEGGGKALAKRYNVPFLGELYLSPSIREDADCGTPTVLRRPSSNEAEAFATVAIKLAMQVARLPKELSGKLPGVASE